MKARKDAAEAAAAKREPDPSRRDGEREETEQQIEEIAERHGEALDRLARD